jgi:hypothetical protein
MRSIAPLAAAKRKHLHWAFGTPATPYPSGSLPDGGTGDIIGLTVELYLGGAWTDISPYIRYADKVVITRGAPDETSAMQPQTCALTIDNRDGRFSPRNPLGPYYNQIGRNTPIRISRLANGIRRYRFYGEVPAWPSTWDITGTEVHAAITASGPSRRLFQGNEPLASAMFRAYGQGLGLGILPMAYWPCEDGANSTQIASGLTGGTAMVLTGQALPTFASDSSFPYSAPLPLLSASIWTGTIPTYAGGTANALGFLLSIPSTGAFDGGVLARINTTGTVARMELVYGATGGGSLAINGYDSTGNLLFASGYQSPSSFTGYGFTGYNGMPVFVDMTLTPSGGNVNWGGDFIPLYPRASLQQSFGISAGAVSGSLGTATSVVINPNGNFNDTAVGHVIYQTAANFSGNVGAPMNGWITEPPTSAFIINGGQRSTGRFLRLCQEQNVQAAVITASGINAGDNQPMGYQVADTFTNLIQQPAVTSAGLLFEARDQDALILRERGTLYNQAAKLTLDHSAHQLSGPLDPVDDDAMTRNDVTVTRIGGSSVQQQQTAGTLSIQPPPNGVGDYSTSYNLSLGADSQVADQAGWRLHLGTVDRPRYPAIPINLRHSTFTTSVDMMNAALTIDIGDRLVVTSPPPWMPPDPISQIVLGYTETLGIWEHDIVFNCAPEDPYRVGLLDDVVLGHLDTDGTVLLTPAGPTDTTLNVVSSYPSGPAWTAAGVDLPVDIAVGGERMTVTAVAAGNIGADGGFELGTAGWTTSNANLTQAGAAAHSGTYGGLLTSLANNAFYFFTARFAVTGGANYTFSHWMRLAAGTPTAEWMFVNWYNAGGTNVGSTTTPQFNPTAAWFNQTMTAAAPATAVTAQFFIQATAAAGGDAIHVDDITVSQAMTVTRSVNGIVKSQTAGTDVRLWQPMYASM